MSLDDAWERVWRSTTATELIEARLLLNRELMRIHNAAKGRFAIATILRTERQIVSNFYHLSNLVELARRGNDGWQWNWRDEDKDR